MMGAAGPQQLHIAATTCAQASAWPAPLGLGEDFLLHSLQRLAPPDRCRTASGRASLQ